MSHFHLCSRLSRVCFIPPSHMSSTLPHITAATSRPWVQETSHNKADYLCMLRAPALSFFLSWVQLLIGMGRRLLQTPEASAYLRAAGGTSFNGGLRWELCFCVCFWSCFSLFSFVLGWWVIACLVTIEYIESISKWVDPVFCRFVLPC